MTRPKQTPEQTAKIIAKLTGMPLPRVAQIMQKFPIDTAAAKLADEVKKAMEQDSKKRLEQAKKKEQDRQEAVNGTLSANFVWWPK